MSDPASRRSVLAFALPVLAGTLLLVVTLPGCRQALGDPCDVEQRCEVGLECRGGRCLPETVGSPLDGVPVDEEHEVDAIDSAVEVFLDEAGTPSIIASSASDGWAVLGYLMARDRWPQLEERRRRAQGRLAEVSTSDAARQARVDLMARHLRITEDAEVQWAALDADAPEAVALEGFARGVNLYLDRVHEGVEDQPLGPSTWFDAAEPWTPVDSLAISRLDALGRGWNAGRELEMHLLVERSLRDFSIEAVDVDSSRRVGFAEDVARLDPIEPARAVHGAFGVGSPADPVTTVTAPRIDSPSFVRGWRAGLELIDELLDPPPRSATAWIGGGRRSSQGGGLVAASLSQPSNQAPRYYAAHLEWSDGARTRRVTGLLAAGVPAFVAGFTDDLAWVDVPSGADVVDLYMERMESSDGRPAARFGEDLVPVESTTVAVESADSTYTFESARLPHHGLFVPSFDGDALTPGYDDIAGLTARLALTADDRPLAVAHEILSTSTAAAASRIAAELAVPTSRWLFADLAGRIASALPESVPRRDPRALAPASTRAAGATPMMVLPGDGTAEWLEESPPGMSSGATWVAEPSVELIVAAGGDPVGASFDNDPFRDERRYLGWSFEPGLRSTGLETRLDEVTRRRVDAAGALLALLDTSSRAFTVLLPALRHALDRTLRERDETGSEPDLMRMVNDLGGRLDGLEDAMLVLEAWDGDFGRAEDGETSSAQAAAIAGAWLPRLFDHVLADELDVLDTSLDDGMALRALTRLFEEDEPIRTVVTGFGESAVFDDMSSGSRYETRDERLVRSFDTAVRDLTEELGEDRDSWSWTELHRVYVQPPLWDGEAEPIRVALPGGPDSAWGCAPSVVSRSPRCIGEVPGARFAVELRPWGPHALVSLAGPQRLDGTRSTYRETLEAWSRGDHRELSSRLDDAVANATARLRFVPPTGD